MVDSIDSGNVGGAEGVGGAREVDGEQRDRDAQISAAADRVGQRGIDTQAQLTAGTDGFEPGSGTGDGAVEAAGRGKAPQGSPGTNPPSTDPSATPGAGPAQKDPKTTPPALRDGDFLHNPRAMTPEQAKGLEDILKKGGLHPQTEKEIRDFLEDYRKGQDRLFPDNPNPYPRPYPLNPAAPTIV